MGPSSFCVIQTEESSSNSEKNDRTPTSTQVKVHTYVRKLKKILETTVAENDVISVTVSSPIITGKDLKER